MVYLITYDLIKPGQNYDKLFEAIKKLGEYCHPLESTWLVDTSLKSAEEINKMLQPHVDQSDRILIIRVTADYFGALSQEIWDWFKQHVR